MFGAKKDKPDLLIQALMPGLNKIIDPMIADARKSLISRIAGDPPENFKQELYNREIEVNEEYAKRMWDAAIASLANG